MQIYHTFETVTTFGSDTEKCISILANFAVIARSHMIIRLTAKAMS